MKKYSLKQRTDYHTKRLNALSKSKNGYKSNKAQYSLGFIKGVDRGCVLDYGDLSKSEKAGQIAGVKARRRSASIKF